MPALLQVRPPPSGVVGEPLTPAAVARATRSMALVRLGIAIVIAAGASFSEARLGLPPALVWITGLIAVPGAALLFFAAERRPSQATRVGGAVSDLLMLAVIQALVPEATFAAPAFAVLSIGAVAYFDGRALGLLLAGGAVALASLTAMQDPIGQDWVLQAARAGLYVVSVLLLDSLGRARRRDTATVSKLQASRMRFSRASPTRWS